MEWLSKAFEYGVDLVGDVIGSVFGDDDGNFTAGDVGASLITAGAKTMAGSSSSKKSGSSGVRKYSFDEGKYNAAKAPDAVAPRAFSGVDEQYWNKVFTYYAQMMKGN